MTQGPTSIQPPSETPIDRGPSRPARRLLVIGLDGATFNVLDPLIQAGRLPRLEALIASGVAGTMRSTVPPITPAAWTTFLTGRQPGEHGILDFERYDVISNRLVPTSTRCLNHVPSLWRILGSHGLRVGSLHVPMTYPPVPVNGFLVSGFETPSADSDFAFPPELKADILARWPDPTLGKNWRRGLLGGRRRFSENLDYMTRSFVQGREMTVALGDRFGWDVLMVVFKLVDNLQHKTWRYIDPRWAHRDPRRRDQVFNCFTEMDRQVGTLIDYASSRDADVLIVSDHGHGSLEGKVQPNRLLLDWGYLKLRRGGRTWTRGRRIFGRHRSGTSSELPLARDLPVDFSRTRACVMHAGMAGFLYLNLAGRQPGGLVPAGEYESLRAELRERLLGPECRAVDPAGRTIQLFTAVDDPETLYGVSRSDQPWMPDLILTPHESLAVVRRIRGARPVTWLPWRRIEGTHRPNGILIAGGPGIAQGRRVDGRLLDAAPTMLTLLGLPVPQEMTGRVLTELFAQAPIVTKSSTAPWTQAAPHPSTPSLADDKVFTDEELAQVTSRLTDLGYLQ